MYAAGRKRIAAIRRRGKRRPDFGNCRPCAGRGASQFRCRDTPRFERERPQGTWLRIEGRHKGRGYL